MRAIILAAGVGWRLKPHTDAVPTCLLQLGAHTLLRRCLETFTALGIPEAVLVIGYEREQVAAEAARGPARLRVRVVENERYMRGNILSLWHARHELDDDVIIMDADVLYPQELLARLLAASDGNAIAVDEQFHETGEALKVLCEDGWVVEISRKLGPDPRVRGQSVGMLRLSAEAAEILRGILEEFVDTGKDALDYEDAFRELAGEVPIGVVEVGDLPWAEVDSPEDLSRAREDILPRIDRLDRGDAAAAG